jgi:hypothetical protein
MRNKLFLVFVFVVQYAFGQDTNILISLNAPALGVKIKNNFPTGSGNFARAFMLSNQDGSVDFMGMGVFGNFAGGVTNIGYGYLGSSFSSPFIAFKPDGNVGIGTTTRNQNFMSRVLGVIP